MRCAQGAPQIIGDSMLIYNIISTICLAYMIGLIVLFFCELKRKMDYKKGVEFIRSFKKGTFTLIYVAAIPLYTMG